MKTIVVIIIVGALAYFVIRSFKKKEDKPNRQATAGGRTIPKTTTTTTRKTQSAEIMDLANNIVAQSTEKGFYWQDFKRRKPEQAADIEALVGKDMSKVSDIDAFQIVATFLRWSENAGCSIGKLKDNFLNDFKAVSEGMDYEDVVKLMRKSRSEEAAKFNISLDNTASAFMLQWIQEEHQKNRESGVLNSILDNLEVSEEEKRRMFESIQDNVDSMGLAPDISGFDHEENRLIALAEKGVEFISNKYKRLEKKGRTEALIYCTTCLIDLPTDYENELDLDKKEDRYFLLLHDKVICQEIEDTPSFINSRINFYNEQKRKLAESPVYSPMFIYNAFYMNPFCKHPDVLREFNESPVELMRLEAVLNELDQFFENKKKDIL